MDASCNNQTQKQLVKPEDSADNVLNLNQVSMLNLSLEEEDALLRGETKAVDPKEPKECEKVTRLEREPRPLCSGPPERNKKRAKRGKRGKTGQAKPPSSSTSTNKPNAPSGVPNIATSDIDSALNAASAANTIVDQSSKRQRSNENSPAGENPRKQRKFVDVAKDDLKLMIIDEDKQMDIDQAGIVETLLHNLMDEYLASNPRKCPTFHDLKFFGGNLRLICADLFSKKWIETSFSAITPPWEGATLKLYPVTPRRPTIRFFVPNGMKKPEFEDILVKLRQQNPPLSTSLWVAWKSDVKEEGIFYHVSVEPETVTLIESMGNRLFYYFSKIRIITPSKKPKEEEGKASEVSVDTKISEEKELK
ncbi:hypothetical protein Bhyg_02002 [Pseudolycoriella hygida]|uniref:DUF4780 domain-containing protein n=1 Tax=Pseudolycoriella hygida TaxID=35572 RepID=A0A9Q0NAL5_9DIPT|nr:hypothetical protein Bhyg_02002 [Pseudolycoriella hygida]